MQGFTFSAFQTKMFFSRTTELWGICQVQIGHSQTLFKQSNWALEIYGSKRAWLLEKISV